MGLYPERIVCLTEETCEILYRIGAEDRIVGISGFTVRPKRARKEKPKVSAYLTADVPAIEALRPDLIFAFSDLQADIVAALIKKGMNVVTFNQRSVDEILRVCASVAALVGMQRQGEVLVAELQAGIDRVRAQASALPRRPRVYFEEWPDPIITGIRWVSELIEIAGGDDVFADRRGAGLAKDRIVTADAVLAQKPEIILASWCGKKVKPQVIRARAGWEELPALVDDRMFEIPSSIILQPGPAALSDGLAEIHTRVSDAAR